jgi:capsular polysaccharide transport system permease protein
MSIAPLETEEPTMDARAPTLAPPQARDTGHGRAPHGGLRQRAARLRGLAARLRRAWPFLLAVVLPTLATAGYLYLVAADQYESEAHFIVRANGANYGPASSLGALFGLASGGSVQAEAHSVDDYLVSHDAVAALGRAIDLPTVFRRREADLFSRLSAAHPTPEALLKYYRRQVKVSFGADSGITTLTVRAFRPADAQQIAARLLDLGEDRVNTFNQRALENTLSVAKAQLREAELGVAGAQSRLTDLRQGRRDINPERTSAAQITLAAGLREQLALARSQLQSMDGAVAADSPQRIALARQVQALAAQVAAADARLAGPERSMAPDLGDYESLQLRQAFAAKRYEAAAAALETARADAQKQQLFVVRVVDPNLPVKATYPHRLRITATVFFGLLLAYAIGWIILAGVREHAL